MARYYQSKMLLDQSLKKVARCGRRTGKCLPGWVKIFDPETGYWNKVEDLFKAGSASVITYDGKSNQLIPAHDCPVFYNGKKEVYRVIVENGKSIDATGNHPLLTPEGWLEIDSLKVGTEVALVTDLCSQDTTVIWQKVLSIKYLGTYDTYDLTVPETHNFVAEEFIVHNTETMCVDALWRTNVNRSYRCIFAAPYESQIRNIFMRLSELVNLSPVVKANVLSNTKTPWLITFHNGSSIQGYTTGASSGGGATTIRGTRADYIYLDESDYMSDVDFDSILAIAAEREGIGIFLSSTPTGARKRFWQCCTDPSMHFTQFHFPSTCNPYWGPKMEEEFRAQLSENGYLHEVMAEFGEQETGVFNKDKVDAAMNFMLYTYSHLTESQKYEISQNNQTVEYYIPDESSNSVYIPEHIKTMGIDWDKQKLIKGITIYYG